MTLAYKAMLFAKTAHSSQLRKYTKTPYSDHLAEVAGIVATIDSSERSIATAWLHDVIEDQGITYTDLVITFNSDIAEAVWLLSDTEDGNRAARKEAYRFRLSKSAAWVQNIKVADLISNTSSIVQYDPKFASVYLEEKRLMLDVLKGADERLKTIGYQND